MTGTKPLERALISTYDKTGLIDLAQNLHSANVEIVSTGSTAQQISEAGIPVTPVSEVTGFPECLDGRVKTLHPGIHAGLLADVRREDHRNTLAELEIPPFDLVVVNLYPFTATVAAGGSQAECVEQIDIGGPAMIRASAKNHDNVAVVTSPTSYGQVAAALAVGGFTLAQRQQLAAQAFAHTAEYDIAVASWFANRVVGSDEQFPDWLAGSWRRESVLRYGENPHQPAAVYTSAEVGVATAELLQGKPMSFNNYVDADAALRAAYDFDDPCVAIIKHTNPCGIAVADTIAVAHQRALATDPVSAFGGVVACNRPVDLELALQLADVFTEVVIAPDFSAEALNQFSRKQNLRLLKVGAEYHNPPVQLRPVSGGLLLQESDRIDATGDPAANWSLVSGQAADEAALVDLEFAWRACRAVKSNAILLAKDQAAVGVGMGQVNRVDSAGLAVQRAGDRAAGSVAASDAFFPFPDGLEVLIAAGVTAVVQPGGSVRDNEVIAAANAANITMYFTGVRHFSH